MLSTKLHQGGALNIDGFCDNQAEELKRQHPMLVLAKVNRAETEGADDEDMAGYVEHGERHINATQQRRATHDWNFNWTLPGMMRGWVNRDDASFIDRRMVSAALVGVSSYHQYVGLCLEAYKQYDPRVCANWFTFSKPLSAYDRSELSAPVHIYGSYPKGSTAFLPAAIVSAVSKAVLYIGLLIFMCEIRLSKRTMVLVVTMGTFVLSLPKLFLPLHRFNPDYPGYIHQASQFSHGQTSYSAISSSQGALQHPIGHLWHYLAVYKLHLLTEHAELIMKCLMIPL